jgi:hypothetical protein
MRLGLVELSFKVHRVFQTCSCVATRRGRFRAMAPGAEGPWLPALRRYAAMERTEMAAVMDQPLQRQAQRLLSLSKFIKICVAKGKLS